MNGFSVVVPTFNMSEHLDALFASLAASGLSADCGELVFVDDGSTDGTAEALARLISADAVLRTKAEVVRLEKNRGRFKARLEGALAADGGMILFVDSRVELPSGFSAKLKDASGKYSSVIPHVEIDETRNIFSLYWKRSHEFIFRKHYRALKAPVRLTSTNFEQFLKGTTVLFCDRAAFLASCARLGTAKILNDDNRVLEEFVKIAPLTIVPDLEIFWVPREDWRGFLHRLWTRGPSFAEYHLFLHRGGFFPIVSAGLVACVVELVLLCVSPMLAFSAFLAFLAAAALSTAIFAKGPREFLKLIALHLCVIIVFSSGILWGIAVNMTRPDMRKSLVRNLLGKSKK